MTNSICSLCKQTAKLCESHIIPEFVYVPLYDENHRMLTKSVNPMIHTKRPRKGIWEHLLCRSCEVRLSDYESEAKKLWDGAKGLTCEIGGNTNELFTIKGFDYKKLKLFQISILWRASVTNNEFFNKVKLGEHEETLRAMLCSENAGKAGDYGCLLFALEKDGKLANNILFNPTANRIKDGAYSHRTYNFVFGGLRWDFVVSSHQKVSHKLSSCFLQDDGTLYSLKKPFYESKPLMDALAKVVHNELKL